MTELPTAVRVRDVGPRDGFQNEPEVIATADKVRLIDALARTGVRRLEVTSFVRADVIPQLADAREVLEHIEVPPGVERSVLDTDATSPLKFRNYVRDTGGPANGIGSSTTTTIPLTAAWQRDSRDSALTPNTGRYQRANLEFDVIGESKYFRTIYEQQYYRPLFRTVTLAMKGEFDYGRSFGGSTYPVFKNFYAGGIGSVRGYQSSSLGPTDDGPNGTRDALGGTARLIGSLELQMPFPGSGSDRSLRWFGFLDGGQVYSAEQGIQLSELRYSAGLGISWISPVGPLKLSFGKALNAKPKDRPEGFQFQMGTGF